MLFRVACFNTQNTLLAVALRLIRRHLFVDSTPFYYASLHLRVRLLYICRFIWLCLYHVCF